MAGAQASVLAGVVGRPHGLDGSVHVLDGRAELLERGRRVRVGSAGDERVVVRRAGTVARPVVRLDGCEDRSAALALGGAELRVSREEAPMLGEEEWWAADLVGCAVRDGERDVGVVSALVGFPSCEALAVDDLLIPLVRDAVRAVDVERRVIDVDLRFLGVAR